MRYRLQQPRERRSTRRRSPSAASAPPHLADVDLAPDDVLRPEFANRALTEAAAQAIAAITAPYRCFATLMSHTRECQGSAETLSGIS